MQVTQMAVDGLKHEFKVVLPAKDIEAKIDHRLGELSREVRVPGFRPGKVPLAVLKKRYGDAVLGEVVERAVSDSSAQAIMEKGLRPALQPKVEITSFVRGNDLEYKLAIEVLPQVDPMDFTKLELERPVAEVTDEEVERSLARLAAQTKKTEPAPPGHKAQKGDVLVIDYKGAIAGEPFPGGEAEGHYVELGSNRFIPGFEEQLEGLEAGDSKSVEVTFSEDHGAEKLRGKQVRFAVTIKEIRTPVASKVDDELAKAMGQDNLEALRKSMRERLEREYAELSRLRLKRALLDALAGAHNFPVPPGMVDLEFAQIWGQVEESRKRGELDPADAAKSEEELKADYRAIAERRVRLGLLLSEVGQRHNITVTPEEVNRAMIEEARRFPGQERRVLEYFKNAPAAVAQLRAPLLETKVVDFILALAKPKERKVAVAELLKEPDETAPDKTRAGPAKIDAGHEKAEGGKGVEKAEA